MPNFFKLIKYVMFVPIIFINVTYPQDSLRLLTEFTQNYKNFQCKSSKPQIKS